MHLQDASQLLLSFKRWVVYILAGFHTAAVDPDVRQFAAFDHGHFEYQSSQRIGFPGFAFDDITGFRMRPFYGRNIDRTWKEFGNRIEEGLDAFIFQGGSAQHGDQLQIDGGLSNRVKNLARFNGHFRQVSLHYLIVIFCSGFNNLFPVFLSLGDIFFADVVEMVADSQAFLIPTDLLHVDQIDDVGETLSLTDGQLQKERIGTETLPHHINGAKKISPNSVHLINEGNFGDTVFIGLAPYRFRLRFHPFHGTENTDCTVKYPQGSFDFDGKIHMPGRIDNMDFQIFPMTGGHSRGNGYAPFLLVDHPIHNRFTVMDLTDLVGSARVIKDPFGDGGFAGIDVRDDSYISDMVDFIFFLHRINSISASSGNSRSI